MGLPNINIIFKEAASTAIQRGERGIVALILQDAAANGFITMETITEIPSNLSEYNKTQIKLAMMGTVKSPSKIMAYVQPVTATDYTEAMSYLETRKFDYLAVPGIEANAVTDIATWVKQLRDTKDIKVKAVLPNCSADHEGIINFATDGIRVNGISYDAKDYCVRIAGILAGLPLNISSTYQVLSEVEDVPHLSKSELDTAIDAGKLILMNDGEKIKIGRGVNSLTTLTADKGSDFKKIKIVDTMDMILKDIKATSEDNYIGKIPNTYDNRCLLIVAIKAYFEELENQQLLDKGQNNISIDTEAQRNFLKGIGVDTIKMSEQNIKEANTKDKVFLASSIRIVDAIEDITLNINM